MRLIYSILSLFFIIACSKAQESAGAADGDYTVEVVADNLTVPWELVYGPDDHIWFTERPGKISRMDVETGEVTELIEIAEVADRSESGLLGLALDPDFENAPMVYTVYTYLRNGTLTEKVVRYQYNGTALTNPEILLDNIPAANNHSGSRLLFLPDNTLLVTTGDALNTSLSQNPNSLAGKTLRMNKDGSIPSDNPVSESYVYSMGHRNAQGLALSANGTVYSSEHGPSSDDELNIIEADRNYGWPNVKGFCDASEQNTCDNLNVKEPVKAWTPTLAVAGLAYYGSGNISEFNNALLMVTLKEADLRVLKLNESGTEIIEEDILFDRDYGRLRAICTAPNGDVYFSSSNRDGRAPNGFPQATDDRIFRIRPTASTGLNENTPANLPINYPVQAEIDLRAFTNIDAQLYNTMGQKVRDLDDAKQMSTQGLPQGWYVLRMVNKGMFYSRKLYKD